MKNFVSFYLTAFVLSFTMLSSCNKNDEAPSLASEEANAMAENESNRVIQSVNNTAIGAGLMGSSSDVRDMEDFLPACATVIVDTINSFKTITIDFGTEPCLCDEWDNRYRQGIITATWTGAYRDSGTVITIVTQDYYQGELPSHMNKFDFNKTVTNMGHNDNGNLHYAINVSSAVITLYTGETITWTSQRDREWIEGEPTLLPFDDKYSITGSASGTDRLGQPFTVTITNPLIFKFGCPWIIQGTMEIQHGSNPVATLDYGDGTCDNNATVTVNGNTYNIEL